MLNRSVRLLIVLILSILLLTVICCDRQGKAWEKMDLAESLMVSNPDLSLVILDSISKSDLKGKEESARYALLKSIALDKNYIDTTNFDVLQPAIDYYIENGNADEKLKTLYYQGTIFLNRNDYDMAMDCYLKANDLREECQDTLMYANMLVAQGNAYAKSFQIEDYIANNLRASQLYNTIGEQHRVFKSLLRALDGCISMGDKIKSDSILTVTETLAKQSPDFDVELARIKMTYAIRFDSDSLIHMVLNSINDINNYDDETKLDITLAYLKVRDAKKAKTVFESIDPKTPGLNTYRYISIRPIVLENNKDYYAALEAFKEFHLTVEGQNSKIYSQKTTVAEDIHKIKIEHLYKIQRKDRQIWLGLCVALVLCIIIGIIYFQLRIGKKNRIISEQEYSRILLENENLQNQNSVLELEKHNAVLELEKKSLAAENMQLKISQLESEGERLKELLDDSKLSKPILDSIQERIGILNGLLAAKISENDAYSKPYDKWINKVTEDRKSFMDSTRLAFWASHPNFMKYLEEHDLTKSEMNYVCLYAIGLRGREIGEYIQLKRHYHISTDIRKKLGLKEGDTNLGLHIRNLMGKL